MIFAITVIFLVTIVIDKIFYNAFTYMYISSSYYMYCIMQALVQFCWLHSKDEMLSHQCYIYQRTHQLSSCSKLPCRTEAFDTPKQVTVWLFQPQQTHWNWVMAQYQQLNVNKESNNNTVAEREATCTLGAPPKTYIHTYKE